MNAYALDWLNLLGRWLHVIAGIAWIGASFYFVWLDNHLLPPSAPALRDKGVGGELWAVHGGGFYNAQKYRVAPATLPEPLHWFKWEAYWTWLSGMFMLSLVYYWQADVYLIDRGVADLTRPEAVGIGLASLVAGWLIYHGLCLSPLARRPAALSAVIALLLAGAAWGYCHVFGGRGAFIHFGALLGSIMVANVFFVIMPAQRALVAAKREGREPDPRDGARGKQRSVHNTYFTLPVLFAMISNHYAVTYGAPANWLVLVTLSTAGAAIRSWFVARHKRQSGVRVSPLPLAAGVLLLATAAFALAPAAPAGLPRTADFARVQGIVGERCAVCHAAVPTQAGFSAPPKGILLDSPEHIVMHATEMRQQISARTMPIGNLTHMTDEERAAVIAWIDFRKPRAP